MVIKNGTDSEIMLRSLMENFNKSNPAHVNELTEYFTKGFYNILVKKVEFETELDIDTETEIDLATYNSLKEFIRETIINEATGPIFLGNLFKSVVSEIYESGCFPEFDESLREYLMLSSYD